MSLVIRLTQNQNKSMNSILLHGYVVRKGFVVPTAFNGGVKGRCHLLIHMKLKQNIRVLKAAAIKVTRKY